MLTKLGAKIASYLGEGDYSAKPTYFDELFKQLSKFYKIADLLPYECYNEQYQLFFNVDSMVLC